MDSNLPLNLIKELAEKMNKLEEKLSEVLKFTNIALQQSLNNSKRIEELVDDITDEFSVINRKFEDIKKNS